MNSSSPSGSSVAKPPSPRFQLPHAWDSLGSLLQTVVVALFLLTFLVQPYLIPSESMERTLLVGDFLLVNKQVYAPSGVVSRLLLPYRPIGRGDIVVFHHTQTPYLIKRVVGVPGDRLRIDSGQVWVNGQLLREPYAAFEPALANPFRDDFPASNYNDPEVDPAWWRKMRGLVQKGELVVPEGQYFVLGDNRNHSKDSRFWGFVPRQEIVARPLVIYFSVRRPSATDVAQVADDRLGHERLLPERLAGFARWKRIFQVIR